MSVVCINWETVHLYGEAWASHFRLRHRIFRQRQGWQLPSWDGMEYDQFDTPAARYLLWLDEEQQARGVTRLIPTTRPYMLKTLWPDWIREDLPRTPTVWEATRFGCDRDLPAECRRRIVAELICACQEFGLKNNVTKYLGIMPVALFKRVIAAAGCPVEILSPPRQMAGQTTAAGYIQVSASVLARVRARRDVAPGILQEEPHLAQSAPSAAPPARRN